MDLLGSIMGDMDKDKKPNISKKPNPTQRKPLGSAPPRSTAPPSVPARLPPLLGQSSSSPAPGPSSSFRIPRKSQTQGPSTNLEDKPDIKPSIQDLRASTSTSNKRPGQVPDYGIVKKERSSFERPSLISRPNYSTGSSVQGGFKIKKWEPVDLNMFEIDISNIIPKVERYHLIVEATHEKPKNFPDKEAKVTKLTENVAKNDIQNQRRGLAMWRLFKDLIKIHPEVFGESDRAKRISARNNYVYDAMSTIYAVPDVVQMYGDEQVFVLEKEQIDKQIAELQGSRIVRLDITMKKTGVVHLSGGGAYETGNQAEATRFMEILTSQELYNNDHLFYNNKYFQKSSRNDMNMGEGKVLKFGFEKNVRLTSAGGKPTYALQLDVKCSAFYSEQSAVQLLGNLTGAPPNDLKDISRKLMIDDKRSPKAAFVRKVTDELKCIVFTTTHLPNKRIFMPCDMSVPTSKDPNPGTSYTFKTADDEEISLCDYFQRTYKRNITPSLPFLCQRMPRSTASWPIEVLKVERGQRVKPTKITPAIQEKITSEGAMLPPKQIEYVMNALKELKIDSSEYYKSFGIKIKNSKVEVQAAIISPPTVAFAQGSSWTSRGETQLRFSRLSFFKPAVVRGMAVVMFKDDQADREFQNRFINMIYQAMFDARMKVDFKKNDIKAEMIYSTDLENLMKSYENTTTTLIIVTKQRKAHAHEEMKLFEAEMNVQTMHLWMNTAMKCCQEGGNRRTMENVLLKLNLKLGGVNWNVEVPRSGAVEGDSRQMTDKMFKDVMFVGFELSHAAAQCKFDQQMNICVGEPSVVGMSYTLTGPTDMTGAYWCQRPREHKILELDHNFAVSVKTYKSKCGKLPEKIVIYRSGVGEGFFDEVKMEIRTVKSALIKDQELREMNKGRPYEPKFVVIIAQKNSNFRFYSKIATKMSMESSSSYQRMKSTELNVQSGTCVLDGVTNPDFEEFILVSQNALKGTVRPVRYTVLINEMLVPKAEIAHITYYLAFGHQVSLVPPGIPNVLYGAENNAKRGRNNFLAEKHNIDRSSDFKLFDGDVDVDNEMCKLTEKLHGMSLLKHMYWA